jgi:hypothetical protein
MTKEKSPTRGDLTSGSPWALISIFPTAFQRRLGHSPSDRGRQALRYRSGMIIAQSNRLRQSNLANYPLAPKVVRHI